MVPEGSQCRPVIEQFAKRVKVLTVMHGKRKSLLRVLAVMSGLAMIGTAAAASLWMNDGELKKTFRGKTIAGLYPSGRGFVETYTRSGRVYYRDDLRRVSGRWSVSSGNFCTLYDGDNSGGCYVVRRVGKNCFEFYFNSPDDTSNQRPEEPAWTAQAWLTDTPSTCVAGSEV